MAEPCFDVAHLGHVELYSDKFDESLDFFTRVYGLTASKVGDGVAYLRAFDDYEFHTLKLTRHHATGVGHVAYRTSSPEALERRVKVIEEMGCGIGWVDGDEGHGRAYRFTLIGGEELTEEEFNAAGGNTSLTHVDFMIGSPQMDIDGLQEDGTREPVMRAGEWAFDA